MATVDVTAALAKTKQMLGITTTDIYDSILSDYVAAASTRLERNGITNLGDEPDDTMLVAQVAANDWQHRADYKAETPRHIKAAIHDRLASLKAR